MLIKIITYDDVELGQIKVKHSAAAFGFMGHNKKGNEIVNMGWHPVELALCVGTSEFATIFSAPNTRVRGIWSPYDMKAPLGIPTNNNTSSSHQGSSNSLS